jgi:hypothetical protein
MSLEKRTRQNNRRAIKGSLGPVDEFCGSKIIENKLDKTDKCGVLLDMNQKPILPIALAMVAVLLIVTMMLPPLPKAKKNGTKIQSVNSLANISFPLTVNIATNGLRVTKP